MNDLAFTPGSDNLAGIVGDIAIIANANILTPPALANSASLVTAATDFVWKTDMKAAKVYHTDETGKVETKTVGERDGKARETVLSFRFPKSGVELEDFIRACQNTPSVIFYRKAQNGKIYMLGVTQLDITSTELSLAISAYFEAGDSSTGEKRADQNGALLSWKFTSAHGPIEYAGSWDNLFVAGPE
jgi:hypothetical protein